MCTTCHVITVSNAELHDIRNPHYDHVYPVTERTFPLSRAVIKYFASQNNFLQFFPLTTDKLNPFHTQSLASVFFFQKKKP